MELLAFKLLMLGIMILSELVGLLPYKMESIRHSPRILSLANCGAGGVFLGAGILHMLPDAEIQFAVFKLDYPFALLGFVVGLSLIFLLEKVVLASDNDNEQTALLSPQVNEDVMVYHYPHYDHHQHHHHHHHHQHHKHHLSDRDRSVFAYVIGIVLSLHSFLEGTALGIEDNIADATVLGVAIVAHKWVESMSLSVAFVKSPVSFGQFIKVFLVYAAMTPLGIGVGIVVSYLLSGTAYHLTVGILESLAAGSFVYVAFMSVLVEEFFSSTDKWLKAAMYVIGLAFISTLAVWA
jgi:zinc transporter 1/2/3